MRTLLLLPAALVLPLSLMACGDKDPTDTGDDDGGTDGDIELLDADDDGFTEDIDCDDSDPDINPGASEVCDGIDNDCDELVDDEDLDLQLASATLWFEDLDDDGFGQPGVYQVACDQPTGFADNAEDCNDGDPATSPDATEVCDGIDNDCSGLVDDDAVDALTWYADTDEDDFGLDDDTVLSCDQPAGYTENFGDCDDTEPTVNPGATEICNDGLDNDCDETFDACIMDADGADLTIFGANAYDETGVFLRAAGDVDGDGYDDFMVGARGYDATDTDAGAAFLHYGPVDALGAIDIEELDVPLVGAAANDKAGRAMATGDVDGDGVVDVVVSAPSADDGGNASGTVYIVSGTELPDRDSDADDDVVRLADAGTQIWGSANFDYAGVYVGAPDVSGDGIADLLVGASGQDGPDNSGAVYMFAGPIAAGDWDLADGGYTTRWSGQGNGDTVGLAVDGRGDFNDDGVLDVLIGAGSNDSSAVEGGAVYVMSGTDTGDVTVTDGLVSIYSDEANSNLGSSVSWLGDWNGDGYDDFVVGRSGANSEAGVDAGQVFLVYGGGWDDDAVLPIEDRAFATINGEEDQDQLGTSVAGMGDHDGDGATDLLMGAVNGDEEAAGAAYLFYGPIEGTFSAAAADSRFAGTNEEDHLGGTVTFAGDVADLGTDAIMIGGVDVDSDTVDVGAAYLIFEIGL